MPSLLRQKTVVYRLHSKDGPKCSKTTPGAVKVTVTSEVWYGQYKDAEGRIQRKPLCADKQKAKEMLNKLVTDAKMAQIGLADPFANHRKRPLMCPGCRSTGKKEDDERCQCVEGAHLTDYRRYLEAKGDTAEHVELTVCRIGLILEGTKAKFIDQISPSRVLEYLAQRRREGISIATSNHYLRAIKGFSAWLEKDRRTGQNLLKHLSCLNAETDRRHRRRNVSVEEFQKLLKTTRDSSREFRGLSGIDRFMLYTLAGYTGLRCSELASLTPSSFDLVGGTVTVNAAYSKRRREDVLPLHPELVKLLAEYLQGKTKDAPVWPGTWSQQASAKMLRLDLEEAGIPYRDEAGRVFDFHATRGQFISELARQGVHPKTAQMLARHSSINLTMNTYTHLGLVDLKSAVENLPPPPTGDLDKANPEKEPDRTMGETGESKAG
jgi:integrase